MRNESEQEKKEEGKKKKVLVFSTIPTHPQDMGCRRRVYNLLDEFQKQNCEIHIVYLPIRKKKEDEESIREMSKKWGYVDVISGKRPLTFSGLINLGIDTVDKSLGGLGKFMKMQFPKKYKSVKKLNKTIQKITRSHVDFRGKNFDFTYEKRIFDMIRDKSKEINPDIFICEYAWYSFVLDAVDENVLKLIDTHDSFTSFARLHRDMLKLHPSIEITEEIEKYFLERADISLAIQDKEKTFFEKLVGKGRTITIGHIISIKNNKIRKQRNNLLFVGSDWGPNIDGILWFMKEVWPILKKMKPNIKLTIFGNVANYVENTKDVKKISYSYNLDEQYEKADVVICPVRLGSGLKIKAIESLGQGRPIVATKHVEEGFGQYNKSNRLFLVTDSSKDYANEIVNLLENNSLYKKRQEEGWSFSIKYNDLQRKRIKFIINLAKKKSEQKLKKKNSKNSQYGRK